MKSLLSVKNLLIAILLIVILAYLVKDCANKPDGGGKTEVVIDTVFKEVKSETKVYVPKWRTKVETVEIPYQVNTPDIPFDTVGLLKEYFSKYAITDTVKLPYGDSTDRVFGYGIILDTITQNNIIARKILWNYRIPIIYKTITIYPEQRGQVYIGATANVNSLQLLSSVSGAFLYKTKRDRIYLVNIGVADNGSGAQPFLGGGIFWKIKLRKPKPAELLHLAK
jgi:hypothetical protein